MTSTTRVQENLGNTMEIIEGLFSNQKQYVNHFFDNLDLKAAHLFFQACLKCPGSLIFTGVGKSGIIAEKIALTLVSTGTRAHFLSPTNFLHGDIAMVSSEDTVVMLSKSGEAEELLNIFPFFKRRGAQILTLVSNPSSRLAKMADVTMFLPVEKELCPFDLAPTTSAAVQLLFGDLLVAALMQTKGFSLDEYIHNHPSGSIGKKMTLKVKDLMLSGEDIPLCSPEQKLVEVLVDLSNKKCGCLLVTDSQNKLLGIFTDGDLRRGLQCEGALFLEKKMEDLMTKTPITVTPNVLAWDAAKIMQDPRRWVMVAPVIGEEGRIVGIIRMHDIIQAGI
ncbi:MAG TPA: KpsF/GutQ family sugar-phosphate isomerase [Rhabdochlamydiaceae bacterium]|nr:KpsF/GutQ family sugar-phosphate isomerase [Rhabdochlamydiaceae bacterium]